MKKYIIILRRWRQNYLPLREILKSIHKLRRFHLLHAFFIQSSTLFINLSSRYLSVLN